jgi:hypothetical protein
VFPLQECIDLTTGFARRFSPEKKISVELSNLFPEYYFVMNKLTDVTFIFFAAVFGFTFFFLLLDCVAQLIFKLS